jgi:hypothetical protein
MEFDVDALQMLPEEADAPVDMFMCGGNTCRCTYTSHWTL